MKYQEISGEMRDASASFANADGWIRTSDPGLMNPDVGSHKGEQNNNLRERSASSATLGATVEQDRPEIERELETLIEAWPDLPVAVKAGIMAMVNASPNNKPKGDK